MPTATIDGLTVNYVTRGSGPALLMLPPGDDPAHATSAAHFVRELHPKAQSWPVMPPDQAPERVRDRILEFRRIVG